LVTIILPRITRINTDVVKFCFFQACLIYVLINTMLLNFNPEQSK